MIGMIGEPVLPAVYINETAYIALGQTKGKKRSTNENSSEEEDCLEQAPHDAKDIWSRRRRLLVPVKKKNAGHYQKQSKTLHNFDTDKAIKLSDFQPLAAPVPATGQRLIKIGTTQLTTFKIKSAPILVPKTITASVASASTTAASCSATTSAAFDSTQNLNTSSEMLQIYSEYTVLKEISGIKITRHDMEALNSAEQNSIFFLKFPINFS